MKHENNNTVTNKLSPTVIFNFYFDYQIIYCIRLTVWQMRSKLLFDFLHFQHWFYTITLQKDIFVLSLFLPTSKITIKRRQRNQHEITCSHSRKNECHLPSLSTSSMLKKQTPFVPCSKQTPQNNKMSNLSSIKYKRKTRRYGLRLLLAKMGKKQKKT